ncbi:MAG TPA: LuxR C-terminal-related transcriptional regulator, partial [Microlunatus sp.]|nr:LuxR C-terminal-related transcriptional regulator [Microlunatus sp.]
ADLDWPRAGDLTLGPPVVREAWIDRPRLRQQLDVSAGSPLLLVVAPAGYGKSTLVTQWAAGRDPATVAWLRLERGDDDPLQLWSRLVAAAERVGCRIDGNDAEFSPASSTTVLGWSVPRIASTGAEGQRPVTIVVEDCHLVRSAESSDMLGRFLDLLPAVVRLVLLSRSDPGLRLGRLRVEGRLAEIRAAELAFTLAETKAVLAVTNITVSDDALQELCRRTEGWPAAIALAALSLVDRPETEAEELVRRLGGSDRFIADYLSEEVLSCQEPELRDFILNMSVFDRFNAAAANEAARTNAAAGLLHRLERNNTFLIPQRETGWYRFHHLFAAYARATLEMEHPERVVDLQRRGARWFTAHGHPEDAIRHLLAAGDTDQAANLIQQHWVRIVDAEGSATVTRWLHGLRGTPADHGAAATVTAAWMAALTGDLPEMGRRLAALEHITTTAALPDGTMSPRSAMVMVRGLVGSDGPDQMLLDSQTAVALENSHASPWHAVARACLGHAGFVTGDLRLARHHLAAAVAGRLAPRTVRILAYAVLSLCEAEHGDRAASRRHAELAMAVVTDHAMQADPHVLPAYTAHGVALAAQDRLPAAMDTLEAGLRFARRAPGLGPWPLIHHLIALASVTARMGDPDGRADPLLAEVATLTPWTDASMAATRARVAAARTLIPAATTETSVVGESLTAREQQVLHRLQGRQTLREIASDLWVSHNTVKTITSSVYRKLGAHSRSEAVTIARQKQASPTNH